jgi:ABC-type oligopeptide transport system substrate-binding subunit
VYSFKRIFDPTVRAQWLFLLEGKIAGADKLQEEARRTGKFDYDKPIEGLRAIDRYTLRIQLVEPDYNLLYILTMPATAAIAREVAEKYGDALAEHPVGTGPYKLGDWRRASRVVLEANPDFAARPSSPRAARTSATAGSSSTSPARRSRSSAASRCT